MWEIQGGMNAFFLFIQRNKPCDQAEIRLMVSQLLESVVRVVEINSQGASRQDPLTNGFSGTGGIIIRLAVMSRSIFRSF
jgi:hypothetical protein